MSILVKGMKMPDSCVECLAVIRDTLTDPIDRDSQKVTRIYNYSLKPNSIEDGWVTFSKVCSSRQKWCPLVELPEKHGRLIEEPKYFDYSGLAMIAPLDFKGTAEYFARQVKEQPTIIEAEGGGEIE